MAAQEAHAYGGAVLSGHARAHLGDLHTYHYYSKTQPRSDEGNETYEILHRSLSYSGMNRRARNVEMALPQTCTWLRSHEHFLSWANPDRVDEHHGLLWLKGKPGSGKSTIMREISEWVKREWKDEMTLSYFFNARSTEELEKSSLGMYRALTYQLLVVHENARAMFLTEFASKERSGQVEAWTEVELQNFFQRLVYDRHLSSVNIFIDALDEGDVDDVQQMVTFFEKLAAYAVIAQSMFRLCLSSRHYPQISIDTGLFIVIEGQSGHTLDIKLYIEKTLPRQGSALMNEIRATLLRKAEGVFLWVVLTVSLLKPLYARGRIEALRKELSSVPPGIYNLFSVIMTNQAEHITECVTLLQWMLVSKRAISAVELYLATRWGSLEHDTNSIDTDESVVTNYILDCSRGLVEMSKDSDSHQVQFIHESVRQFLNKTVSHNKTYGQDLLTVVFDFHPEVCHAVVAEVCLDYLMHVCGKDLRIEELLSRYELVRYAATYWWQHLQAAGDKCTPRALDLAAQLLTGPTRKLLVWIRAIDTEDERSCLLSNNSCMSLRSKGSSWQWPSLAFNGKHHSADDLLADIQYAAFIGIPALFVKVLETCTDVAVPGSHYGNALSAACAEGHREVAEMLLDNCAGIDTVGRIHVSNEPLNSTTVMYEASPLEIAAICGHKSLVHMLLDRGADINTASGNFSSALVAVVFSGHLDFVRTFLDRGADVNSQGGSLGTALQVAVAKNYTDIVQVLLESGADVNASGKDYGTALAAACRWGSEETIEMLLSHSADINRGSRYWDHNMDEFWTNNNGEFLEVTPIHASYHSGRMRTTNILLGRGAGTDDPGQFYEYTRYNNVTGTVLQMASYAGDMEVVSRLLDNGVDINANCGEFGTALHAAIAGTCSPKSAGGKHVDVIQLLLERGAEVNAIGGNYGSAIVMASSLECYAKEIVRALLDGDADLMAGGNVRYELGISSHGSALEAASFIGNEEVVRMLLDRDLAGNAFGQHYGQALISASARGAESIVQILLKQGADPRAVGQYFGWNGWSRVILTGDAIQAALRNHNDRTANILKAHVRVDDEKKAATLQECTEVSNGLYNTT